MPPLTETEEIAWRSLARLLVVAPRLLDEDLQSGARMTISEYSVLMHLSESEGRRLRMSDVANRIGLSGSRITRLVDQLAAEGLVVRRRCPTDGRGMTVELTEAGMARLREAYPVHLRSVRERILAHIADGEKPGLAKALTSIAASFEG